MEKKSNKGLIVFIIILIILVIIGLLYLIFKKDDEEDKSYIRKERVYGKNVRKFYIGEVDEENITAEFKDGILKVVVPKKEEINNKKKITIE